MENKYNKHNIRFNPLSTLNNDYEAISKVSNVLLFGKDKILNFMEEPQRVLVSKGIEMLSKYENGKYLSIPHLAELLKLDPHELGQIMEELGCYFHISLIDNANEDHVICYVKSVSIELNRHMTPYAYWLLAPEKSLSPESAGHPVIPTLSSMPEDSSMLHDIIKRLYEIQDICVTEEDINTIFEENVLEDNERRIKNDIKQMVEDLIVK